MKTAFDLKSELFPCVIFVGVPLFAWLLLISSQLPLTRPQRRRFLVGMILLALVASPDMPYFLSGLEPSINFISGGYRRDELLAPGTFDLNFCGANQDDPLHCEVLFKVIDGAYGSRHLVTQEHEIHIARLFLGNFGVLEFRDINNNNMILFSILPTGVVRPGPDCAACMADMDQWCQQAEQVWNSWYLCQAIAFLIMLLLCGWMALIWITRSNTRARQE